MVAHGSFYKQDVPDRKCGKVSADINQRFHTVHFITAQRRVGKKTVSKTINSKSIVHFPTLPGKKVTFNFESTNFDAISATT